MSNTTLRKRIALSAIAALTAGMLSFASAPVASAHGAAGAANVSAAIGTENGSLFVATLASTGASATAHSATAIGSGHVAANSKGLLVKDSSSGTAQTATALTGAVLSFYAPVTVSFLKALLIEALRLHRIVVHEGLAVAEGLQRRLRLPVCNRVHLLVHVASATISSEKRSFRVF